MRAAIETNKIAKSSSDLSEALFCSSSAVRLSTYSFLGSFPETQVDSNLCRMRASSLAWRSDLMKTSVDLTAERSIATANTAPTNSSSFRDASSAPATSSSATWNDTEMLRSDPIEESALAAVPPIPGTEPISFAAVKRCAMNYRTLLPPFCYCTGSLLLRELKAGAARGKRGREGAPTEAVVYGATVGAVLEFVAHPGLRQSHVQRRVRAKITSLAGLHARTLGPDGELLAAGMASARVPSGTVRVLSEFKKGRTSSRQGSLCTILGACVALLVAVEVVAELEVPEGDILTRAAERAACALEDMDSFLADEARASEARAMRRLADASRKSRQMGMEMHLGGAELLVLQLRNAARAAFPDAEVSCASQNELLQGFRARAEYMQGVSHATLPARGNFVPLAAIGSVYLGELDGTSSASSSSCSSVD